MSLWSVLEYHTTSFEISPWDEWKLPTCYQNLHNGSLLRVVGNKNVSFLGVLGVISVILGAACTLKLQFPRSFCATITIVKYPNSNSPWAYCCLSSWPLGCRKIVRLATLIIRVQTTECVLRIRVHQAACQYYNVNYQVVLLHMDFYACAAFDNETVAPISLEGQ